MIPAFAATYVGLPYKDKGRGPDGWDCWGLTRAILSAERGISLPSYADAYLTASDRYSVSEAVQTGLQDGWQQVDKPQAFDLLILRIAGRPWHCALCVNDRQFIHIPPPNAAGVQQLSCIERLDSPHWAARLRRSDFWRYSGVTTAERE